ncbi:MAG: substrate-binding domain-containing protein, partial [Anaerolineae bacterium]
MAAGYGVDRQPVMYNDFVIVGPASDPAGIRGLASAPDAFRRIAEAQALFVSRGDESGTHVKEEEVWQAAGITPAGDWYRSIGQGMGPTLTTAAEIQAYTLSDRATFLTMKAKGLALEILVEGDANLLNPYSVIAVNPQRYPGICYSGAKAFIEWITSLPAQELIASFGRDIYGQSIFFPDSTTWRQAHR